MSKQKRGELSGERKKNATTTIMMTMKKGELEDHDYLNKGNLTICVGGMVAAC